MVPFRSMLSRAPGFVSRYLRLSLLAWEPSKKRRASSLQIRAGRAVCACAAVAALACSEGSPRDATTGSSAMSAGAGIHAPAPSAGSSPKPVSETPGRAQAPAAVSGGSSGMRSSDQAGTQGGSSRGTATPAGATGGTVTPGSGGRDGTDALPALFPSKEARGVCPDPPLRVRFAGPPSFGKTGKIRVFEVSSPSQPVAVVDLASERVDDKIGGTTFHLPRPAYVEGNEAIVRLPAHALSYGRSYYVTLDSDALKAPDGTAFTITDNVTWRFTTSAAAPTDTASLRVALDGTGQFCSVQGALDALPARSASAATIAVEAGTYFEVVRVGGKSRFTLRGSDRKRTILLGVNNNELNPSTATRSLVGIDDATDLVIENLTIHNLTPQGGSQAEALRMQRCERCIVRHADILSLQDTLLWEGRIYAEDIYVEGNVDFVWGTGAVYIAKSEIRTVGRAGWVVQARNGAGSGYVFVDSKISAAPGVTGVRLGRVDASVYPASEVAYVNCQMGSHIAPEGWTVTGGASPSLRFWEYQSTDATGAPLNVSARIGASRQISSDQAAALRDPAQVLGGWAPPP